MTFELSTEAQESRAYCEKYAAVVYAIGELIEDREELEPVQVSAMWLWMNRNLDAMYDMIGRLADDVEDQVRDL